MIRLRGALLVLALLLAGCTTGDPAAPADGPPAPPAAPTRPREVRIDGVDPCTLLTEAQRAELGLDARPVFDRSPSLLYPGEVPMCVTRGFTSRAVVLSVSTVTTAGIEFLVSGDLAAEVRAVQVAGFPAVVAVPTRYSQFCAAAVDVAPGQLIDVQALDGGRQPPIAQDQLCQHAQEAAAMVMSTLLALR